MRAVGYVRWITSEQIQRRHTLSDQGLQVMSQSQLKGPRSVQAMVTIEAQRQT